MDAAGVLEVSTNENEDDEADATVLCDTTISLDANDCVYEDIGVAVVAAGDPAAVAAAYRTSCRFLAAIVSLSSSSSPSVRSSSWRTGSLYIVRGNFVCLSEKFRAFREKRERERESHIREREADNLTVVEEFVSWRSSRRSSAGERERSKRKLR